METDWTSDWTPPARDQPELDAETLDAVRALQAGETEASTRHIFATFEPELCAYFRRHGCQDDEADDLTQNVFIQVLDQIGTLKEPTSFHFWLFKIAGNYLRNFVRDRVRSQEGLEDFADQARRDSESGAFWGHGTFEPNPEAQLTVSETVDRRRLVLGRLFKAAKLAPRTRQAFLLRLQGASYEEIARAFEIPVNTVGVYVSRARAALSRALDGIDLDAVSVKDSDALEDSDDDLADLAPELLTFRREVLEAARRTSEPSPSKPPAPATKRPRRATKRRWICSPRRRSRSANASPTALPRSPPWSGRTGGAAGHAGGRPARSRRRDAETRSWTWGVWPRTTWAIRRSFSGRPPPPCSTAAHPPRSPRGDGATPWRTVSH